MERILTVFSQGLTCLDTYTKILYQVEPCQMVKFNSSFNFYFFDQKRTFFYPITNCTNPYFCVSISVNKKHSYQYSNWS